MYLGRETHRRREIVLGDAAMRSREEKAASIVRLRWRNQPQRKWTAYNTASDACEQCKDYKTHDPHRRGQGTRCVVSSVRFDTADIREEKIGGEDVGHDVHGQ